MARLARIPIPPAQRWRLFSRTWLPLMVFVVVVGTALLLWRGNIEYSGLPGQWYTMQTDIASDTPGTLVWFVQQPDGKSTTLLRNPSGQFIDENGNIVSLGLQPTLKLYSVVKKGDVIAQLDPTVINERIAVLQAEGRELDAESVSIQAEIHFKIKQLLLDQWNEISEGVMHDDGLKQFEAELLIQLKLYQGLKDEATAALKFATERADTAEELYKDGKIIKYKYLEDIQDRAIAEKQLATYTNSIKEITEKIGISKDRIAAHLERLEKDKTTIKGLEEKLRIIAKIDDRIEPFKKRKITVLEKIDEQLALKKALTIRTSIDGQITAIHLHPGQPITAGTPIVTITANESPFVVAYLRKDNRRRVVVGTIVDVRFRAGLSERVPGKIVDISSSVESIPDWQLLNSRLSEEGRPIAIKLDRMPKDIDAPRPGEIVQITIHWDEEPVLVSKDERETVATALLRDKTLIASGSSNK